MTDALIIGYGNPLCGDDGVAWHVVEMLGRSLPENSAIAIHQLTPEWAEAISRATQVVFVDAALGDMAGEVRCIPLAAEPAAPGSHEMTPGGLLAMAADLFGRCPPAHIVAITGGSYELAESLSAPVAAAVPRAAAVVLQLLSRPAERQL